MAKDIGTSNLIDVWASAGPVSEPDISKKNEGWQLGEQPPHEFMNWLQNTFGEKLNHVLKNGVATWNNETQYAVGNAVQHNGFIWKATTTNSNSTPTDGNAAWNRLVEKPDFDSALAAIDASQVISGTFADARIPNLAASKITSGTFADARIPNLAASKITSGVFSNDRISSTLTPDKAFRRGNILGTVSRTGSVPTGALIQRGSNANGDFARFADGTQICTHQVTEVRTDAGVVQTNWTMPIGFASTGSYIPTATAATSRPDILTNISGIRQSATVFQVFAERTNDTSTSIYVQSIGNWF